LLYPGCVVPPFYDSLLAKLIVHDESRPAAIERLARALRELHIGGLKTTIPLHRALLADDDVRIGRYHTNYLEAWMDAWRACGETASPVEREEVVAGSPEAGEAT
jgi:acetyl-CoA carboxylase biotin carboxylase subunit